MNLYIKSYKDFERVDEKISWKGILWGLAIALSVRSIYHKAFDKKDVDQLLHDIKSQESKPSIQTSEFFNTVRKDVINNIQNSNKIDSSTKQKIVDSLKTIPFYIIDSKNYKGIDNTQATFISLVDDAYTRKTVGEDMQLNFIIINKDCMSDPKSLSNTIAHEIYHYVDRLLGHSNKRWSELNNITDIIDKECINDKEYFRGKLSYLLYGTMTDSKLSKKEIHYLDATTESYWENRKYYVKPSELFVRVQGLKRWLISEGQIKSMNDEITNDNLEYVFKQDFYDLAVKQGLDFAEIVPFLDFGNSDNFNKIISKNKSEPNKLS